jgi:ABC-2 type transport system ATP-binding protein
LADDGPTIWLARDLATVRDAAYMDESVAIRVSGLRKRYGSVAALDGVDLEIARGEVFAVLGPNGAGKTTMIEILEGYRERDGGTAVVLGEDPARAGRRWRSRIGIVLQLASERGFEVTVAELVRQFAAFYPRPRDPGEVIELVGLTDKADARMRSLSGGQQRRLDVALGIIGQPELLFLDEPTTGFDPEARRQFWDLIRRLAADGTTILLTTHYLNEAEALAGRVAVLTGGRIAAVGDPGTLGGRATADACVSWDGPEGRRSLWTPVPARVVTDLADAVGGEVPGLTVTRPTLEDVYLDLIGAGR